jgi:hypothetical protein
MLAHRPWFRLWQQYGARCRTESQGIVRIQSWCRFSGLSFLTKYTMTLVRTLLDFGSVGSLNPAMPLLSIVDSFYIGVLDVGSATSWAFWATLEFLEESEQICLLSGKISPPLQRSRSKMTMAVGMSTRTPGGRITRGSVPSSKGHPAATPSFRSSPSKCRPQPALQTL